MDFNRSLLYSLIHNIFLFIYNLLDHLKRYQNFNLNRRSAYIQLYMNICLSQPYPDMAMVQVELILSSTQLGLGHIYLDLNHDSNV